MTRPQSKGELLDIIDIERTKLNDVLGELSKAQMEIPGACENWSVKDILSHLVDWEQRCLRWYMAGLLGEVPKTPDKVYNWHQLPALNQTIYEKHKDKSLEQVHQEYDSSFKEFMAEIEKMSEEALFLPQYFEWTGKGLLCEYVNANTANHYRWASKLICKFTRNLSND